MATTVKIREKYQVTIPEEVRSQVSLKVGERVEVAAENGVILIRPILEVPRSQAWFWEKGWQDQIAKSLDEIRRGKAQSFRSVAEAKEALGD